MSGTFDVKPDKQQELNLSKAVNNEGGEQVITNGASSWISKDDVPF
jgi:hypothetical protein